tara:strand:- start:1215 stop:1700 length:486 start_codon:yes stop_codon:yes gene_type:complete
MSNNNSITYSSLNFPSNRVRKAFSAAYNEALIKKRNLETTQHPSESRCSFIHGAAVFNGNEVIGSGHNRYDRNYIQGRFYVSLHAELSALINSASLPQPEGRRSVRMWSTNGISRTRGDLRYNQEEPQRERQEEAKWKEKKQTPFSKFKKSLFTTLPWTYA